MMHLRFSRSRTWLALLVASVLFAAGCDGDSDPSNGPPIIEAPLETVTATFDSEEVDPFQKGTSPLSAVFEGGSAAGDGAWIIAEEETGEISLTTRTRSLELDFENNYLPVVPRASKAGGNAVFEEVTVDCGVSNQGNDNTEAYNALMYVRGFTQVEDPGTAANSSTRFVVGSENLLVNFGNNIYKTEMIISPENIAGGRYDYKIADGGWSDDKTWTEDTNPLQLGTPLTLVPGGSGAPNGSFTAPSEECYAFELDTTDVNAPVLTATIKKDDDGGPGPEPDPDTGAEVRVYDTNDSLIATFDASPVSLSRTGGETAIARIEVENRGGDGDVGVTLVEWTATMDDAPPIRTLSMEYHRADANYDGVEIEYDSGMGTQTAACIANPPTGYGWCAAEISVYPTTVLTYRVLVNGEEDPAGTLVLNVDDVNENNQVLTFSGSAAWGNNPTNPATGEPLAVGPNEFLFFFECSLGAACEDLGVHIETTDGTEWTLEGQDHPPEYVDEDTYVFRITRPQDLPKNGVPTYSANPDPVDTLPPLVIEARSGGVDPDPGSAPDPIDIAVDGNLIFATAGVDDISSSPFYSVAKVVGPAACHWVYANDTDGNVIACSPGLVESDATFELLYSANATIKAGLSRFTGADGALALTPGGELSAPDNQLNLSGWPTFTLPGSVDAAQAKELLKYQLVLVQTYFADGSDVAEGTKLQTPGALDNLYAEAAAATVFGPDYGTGAPTPSVWAPTAMSVALNIYDTSAAADPSAVVLMDENSDSGVWSTPGDAGWDRKFYTYTVTVYRQDVGDNVNTLGEIVTVEVTDPYSVSLATDSARSQFVNLDDADLKPAGWDGLIKPALAAPEDITLYELHVRDFSIADDTVSDANRGKFMAFTELGSNGMTHLTDLQSAGLSHVHLLPSFDIATVLENRAERIETDDLVDDLCAAVPAAADALCPTYSGQTIREVLESTDGFSTLQQQIVTWMGDLDGFNWGYDPWHYNVPEGSYATDPDGPQRILEFREMVAALNSVGLRTIIDVVYNHTNASGLNTKSVLDKVVPWYYHRRNEITGDVLRDSCCDDTAPEYAMMGKLVVDSTTQWVEQYKVSGFRFDLMGFHPKTNIEAVQSATKAIDDTTYIYGEGWNFGDVGNDRRFVQATQANMAGTGVGTFNDRIRDGLRGGGPFDSGEAHVRNQGWINGGGGGNLNNLNQSEGNAEAVADANCSGLDWIMVSMAGNLAGFRLYSCTSEAFVNGSDVDYNGQNAGYTEDPQEIINYAFKHDNETLWDISQYKNPEGTAVADRVRAQNLGVAAITLGQGIPFFQAGGELLRSKSMDRDSFNSGDWFNELDFSRQSNKWRVGLPVADKNESGWPLMSKLFEDSSIDASAPDIQQAIDNFKEMLAIRKSTNLLRLRDKDQINQRVSYYNPRPDTAGVRRGILVQGIDGCVDPNLTPDDGGLVLIQNVTLQQQVIELFLDDAYELHPIQQASMDPVVQMASYSAQTGFTVPALTTAVFRKDQTGELCDIFGATTSYVRGGFNDWGIANPLIEVGETGVLQTTASVDTTNGSSFEYKIASEDWATINCGGPEGDPTDVPLDDGEDPQESTFLTCGANPGNLRSDFPATGNYKFSLDTSDQANPELTVLPQLGDGFGTTTTFVRGGFNDWGTGNPMIQVGDSQVVETTIEVDAAGYEFKIAAEDWATINCGGPDYSSPMTVSAGSPTTLSCSRNPANLSAAFSNAGQVKFSLDTSDTSNPRLTVSDQEGNAWGTVVAFVRGGFNDWGTGNPLENNAGAIYQGVVTSAAGGFEFKVAAEDWATINCGGADGMGPVQVGTPTILSCGANPSNLSITLPDAGDYSFDVDVTNPNNPTLTITPQ